MQAWVEGTLVIAKQKDHRLRWIAGWCVAEGRMAEVFDFIFEIIGEILAEVVVGLFVDPFIALYRACNRRFRTPPRSN